MTARCCGRSPPVSWAIEPVVNSNPLPRDTWQVRHPSYHSLPSLGCPRYPFIDQRVDENLGEVCAGCGDRTPARGFVARHADHYTTEALKMFDANNIWCSQAVTHPSTNQTQRCLTSLIGREAVCSTWYGRWHQQMDESGYLCNVQL